MDYDVGNTSDAVSNQLADPNIKSAISLTPLEQAIQAQATKLGGYNVVAHLGAVNNDATNLGSLAALYQGQLAAGPGAMSQAAALQAARNTNAVGGLRSLAAGAQGEQAVGAVGQAEANKNAAGAISYGNNAALARIQALQNSLQAHFDNLSNHVQGTTLARNIGLAAGDRQNSLTAMQDTADMQQQNIALGNQTAMTQFTQGMVGAGLGAAASGIATGYAVNKSGAKTAALTTPAQTPTADLSTTLGDYSNSFGSSGAPDASSWTYAPSQSSYGLQSVNQTAVT